MRRANWMGVRLLWTAFVLLAGSREHASGQVVYVPNAYERNVSVFVINSAVGTLTELSSRVPTPGSPTAVAVDPKGRFAYVVVNPPAVVAYSINPSTGNLSQAPGATATLGGTAVGASVDPAGKYLFVANQGGSNVVAFSINAASGALTRVPGTPFAAGRSPSGVIVEPAGKFVYVSNDGSNNVSAFAIDAATGALTAVPGSPFAAGQRPSRLATDAAGKFLYVTNQGSNSVSAFAIDGANGALTAVPGSPFAAGAGPTAPVVDPTGSFLYATNGDGANISGYRIDAGTGALSPLPASPFRTKRGPFGAVFESTGRYLYVPNLLGNNVSAYAMDADSGALSPVAGAPFAAGGGPQRPAFVQLTPPVVPPVVAREALNAASRALPGLPNYGVAQGATFAVSGQNLGPAVKQTAGFPLTAQLGGSSVEVRVGEVRKSALMVSSFHSEVTAILPSSTPLGDGTVTLTYNNRTSRAVPIRVVSASFGIFTRNQAGSGAAVAQNYNSDADQPANSLTEAARPGQKMVLFGTGLGAVKSDETQAPPRENVRDDVEVWVGNRRAEVSYKGRSPQAPGMDEIDFTIPADVTPGCYAPVAVKLGTPAVVSNFATIAVAAEGKTCSDPHGLSTAELAALGNGLPLNIGFIQLLRMNVSATIPGLGSGSGMVESGWASFFRWDPAAAASEQGLDMFSGRGTSLGACAVYTFRPGGPGMVPWRVNALDGGPVMRLTGPAGSRELAQTSPGYYDAHKALGAVTPPGFFDKPLPVPYLEPGKITVDNGAGGPDLEPFQAALTIPDSPAALNWTNFDAITSAAIDRSTDLTITWTGGDSAGEYIVIGGLVALPSFVSKDMQAAAAFVCAESAGAGRFTIPSPVLSALPASTPDDLSGLLMVGRAPLLTDSLKFKAAGLDTGYLTAAQFKGTLVTFR